MMKVAEPAAGAARAGATSVPLPPRPGSPAAVLTLQRLVGNQAVAASIRPKPPGTSPKEPPPLDVGDGRDVTGALAAHEGQLAALGPSEVVDLIGATLAQLLQTFGFRTGGDPAAAGGAAGTAPQGAGARDRRRLTCQAGPRARRWRTLKAEARQRPERRPGRPLPPHRSRRRATVRRGPARRRLG